MASAEWELA